MKRQRRQNIQILAGASLVAAIGCWQWVVWPTRTAQHFVELVVAGREGDYLQLLRAKPPYTSPSRAWRATSLVAHNRSWSDVVSARQTFTIWSHSNGDLADDKVHFTVDLGKITSMEHEFPFWPNGVLKYQR